VEQVNLFGDTRYETLIANYYQDRQVRCNSKELSFVPSSLWEIPTKNKYLTDLIEDTSEIREVKRTGGALGERGLKFSEFKPDVAERVIEFWSDEGDLVLDPFAGRATRAIVATILGRYYLGYEIISSYRDFLLNRVSRLPDEMKARIDIRLGDGIQLKELTANSVDLIFTCPPYWNLERYKPEKEQLSACATYPDFLKCIGVALDNCYRVLKQNCFLCWVVADWFFDGVFYPFHKDVMCLLEEKRFTLHDVVIIKVYSPFVSISAGQNKRAKRMGKQHEYLIVAKKA